MIVRRTTKFQHAAVLYHTGDTPLIHAARQGHFSTAELLLERGADAFATPSEHQPTALHHAAGTGLISL